MAIFHLGRCLKNYVLVTLSLLSVCLHAQHSISGTFSPAKEFTWLLAYKLLPGDQNYVADTAIDNGNFTLLLPQKSDAGIYRLVYALPQETFYFDLIFNGKEDVKLHFNADEGLVFTASNENILFGTYFNEINGSERRLIGFYAEGKTDVAVFRRITAELSSIQQSYEEKTNGLLTNDFVRANRPYIPIDYESIHEYVRNKKATYFKNLDLYNPLLQASGFLTDKLINYAFTALPMEQLTQQDEENHIKENISTIFRKLEKAANDYKFSVLHSLLSQADIRGLIEVSDFIHSEYLKPMATTVEQREIVDGIETRQRLRIGASAPDIAWKDGENTKTLSTLDGAKTYVLIFWSSTCTHCLQELPPLHKKLKEMTDVKVIAIGLEDDKTTWKPEIDKLNDFEHVIALGKWESEYAKLYNIQQTPSYFILDGNKKILAKPSDDKEVIQFLKDL